MAMSLKKKATSQPVPDSGEQPMLVPTSTSFDFLAGAFARAERTRQTLLALLLVAAILFVGLCLLGLKAKIEDGGNARQLAITENDIAAANADLAQIDSAGGKTSDQLTALILPRQAGLAEAVASEVDVERILDAIDASRPAGAELTSVQFTTGAPAAGAAAATDGSASSGTSANPSPAAPSPGGAPAAGGTATATAKRTVAINGTVPTLATLKDWEARLKAVPGLGDIATTWSGGGDTVVGVMTATLSDQANTARSSESKTNGPTGIAAPAGGEPGNG